MRDGFILHTKTMEMIECMDGETLKEFMTALIAHFRNEEAVIDSLAVKLAFIDAKERMDADAEAYENSSGKRSAAGKKGAEARWGDSKSIASDGKRMASDGNAMANDGKHMANDSVSVSVSVSDSVSDSVLKEKEKVSDSTSPQPKRKRFEKPTVEEVRAYCLERNSNVDAETFVDFYDSKGWFVGKNPMKDWKAAVRTWERSPNRNRGKPKDSYPRLPNGEIDWSRV